MFTIPNFLTAGSGREMLNIIEQLDKDEFDIAIAINAAGGALYEEIVAKGYNVIARPVSAKDKKLIPRLNTMLGAGKYFRQYKIDIWVSFNWSSDYTEAIIAKLSGAKYVYVKKNMNWHRKAWILKSLAADAIVARNTDLIRRYFDTPFFKRKTHLISGGVDIMKFRPGASSFREIHNIHPEICLITCVAQLVRVKDQLTLIKAAAEIDNCILVLAGKEVDEVYVCELKEFITKHNLTKKILLAGNVADVHDLLRASDIFVLPTSTLFGHEEGCPVAVLEAMATGVPVIASNVSGSRDLVKDGVTGLLFEHGNIAELVRCIRKIQCNKQLAEYLSANAIAEVMQHNTLPKEAAAFHDLFTKLLKG